MDEREAIERLKGGDVGGLESLMELYYTRAVRTAYLIARDRAMAEDVAQGAFVKAYEKSGQFDADRPFGPWFMKIVVNDAVKASKKRERTVPLGWAAPKTCWSGSPTLVRDPTSWRRRRRCGAECGGPWRSCRLPSGRR
jgi:DNA-directed RNA polymerase specialized sigma24 family protein